MFTRSLCANSVVGPCEMTSSRFVRVRDEQEFIAAAVDHDEDSDARQ